MGCPVECTAPGADKRNGCPKCQWRIKYKGFEYRCRQKFKKLEKYKLADEKDYPIDRLIEYLTVAMSANGQTRRGHGHQWNVILGRLVDIYRNESSRMQAIDSWNHRQEMKSLLDELKTRRGSGSGRDDDDED